MKITMIVNPNAGKKKGLSIAHEAAEALKKEGKEIEILVSEKKGDTLILAENLSIEGVDAVLAVGGDGTLFEIINGLLSKRETLPIPIGQIPVGTGNSFIKDLGIESVDDALTQIKAGKTRNIDLGEFSCSEGKFYFANLLGSGFVSNVAYRAKRYKMLGSFAYVMGVLEEVIFLKPSAIEIELDGKLIKRDALFTEICNSKYTGGDMLMAPDAKIYDGLLDIVLLNKVSRRKVLSLFPAIFKGKHVEDEVVECFKGKKISVKSDRPLLLTPDGETFGMTPIEVQIHPGKIRMYC
jgi:diacylglycerol kinase (ATP)